MRKVFEGVTRKGTGPAIFLAAVMATTPLAATDGGGMALPAPVTDEVYLAFGEAEVRLGRDLFYDPLLSGNRNIACATCHHPRHGSADGLSLGLGEGGKGLGPDRVADTVNTPEQRIPRNAPALWNLGAKEFTVLFHDGRVEVDPSRVSGLRTPLEEDMEIGFANLLSAQSMFPMLSPNEMAGHYKENEIALAVRLGRLTGENGAFGRIAKRIEAVPDYRDAFAMAYPEIAAGRPIAFTDITNAIASFLATEFRSDTSPFDAALRGETELAGAAADGMKLFYGEADCATCHAGPFLTDHKFHAMGQPQIGPGKAERFEKHDRDVGRMRVTNDPADAYAFRTPSLRNILKTGPWGHSGAYSDMAAFIAQHADPVAGLFAYDRTNAVLPPLPNAVDHAILDASEEVTAIAAAVKVTPVALMAGEIDALIAFLGALTDEAALSGRLGVPETVPSGLPVDR